MFNFEIEGDKLRLNPIDPFGGWRSVCFKP